MYKSYKASRISHASDMAAGPHLFRSQRGYSMQMAACGAHAMSIIS